MSPRSDVCRRLRRLSISRLNPAPLTAPICCQASPSSQRSPALAAGSRCHARQSPCPAHPTAKAPAGSCPGPLQGRPGAQHPLPLLPLLLLPPPPLPLLLVLLWLTPGRRRGRRSSQRSVLPWLWRLRSLSWPLQGQSGGAVRSKAVQADLWEGVFIVNRLWLLATLPMVKAPGCHGAAILFD